MDSPANSQVEPSGVRYSGLLPLSWRIAQNADQTAHDRLLHANITLLRGLASIEAATSLDNEHVNDPAIAKALDRLESKVDIMISLLAGVLTGMQVLPVHTHVELGTQEIGWVESPDTAPQPGQELMVTIFLSPKLPQALMLPVRVKALSSTESGCHVSAELLEKDDEFEDWITRTIFRFHRRELQIRHQQLEENRS